MTRGRHRRQIRSGMGAAAIATSGAFALVPMVMAGTAQAATPGAPTPRQALPAPQPAAVPEPAVIPMPRHALAEESIGRHHLRAAGPGRHALADGGSASAAASDAYTVRPGDTLSAIASAHGMDWESVWEANKASVPDANLLRPGERLQLPATDAAPSKVDTADRAEKTAKLGKAEETGKHRKTNDGDAADALHQATDAVSSAVGAKVRSGPTQRKKIWLTGYSYQDNTPAGSAEVSHPILHKDAGGTGTYADPITVAVPGKGGGIWAAGSRFYLPTVKRYVIVEDTGASPAPSGQDGHLDMWIGGQGGTKSATDACMDKITGKGIPATYNPPPNLPVIKGPVWNKTCNIPGSA